MEKGGEKPAEETDWLMLGVETIPLQLWLDKAEGVIV